MTKVFNKGDAVTYIRDWDRCGSTYFRHAVVYSCGKKQMVLTDAETGEEMGRLFAPERGALDRGGTFPRLTDAEAAAAALALAESVIARELARFERCLQNDTACEGYKNAIRRNIAELHAPDAEPYAVRCAAIRASI